MESLSRGWRWLIAVFGLVLLQGCTVNPVTGERQLSLIPESQTREMGVQQYEPTIQMQGGQYYTDPELTVYVNNIGQKLAAVSDRPDLPYEFVVLNSGVPNAWALPGGKIAINRGLLTEMENEAQLAAVLAHEIVHAAARHSAQRMQQGMIINAGMAGLGMALSDNDYAGLIMGGAALGSQLTMAQYSQDHELESDRHGIRYMAKAGYDPRAAVELQKIFLRLSENRESSWINGLFASHPPSQARVDANRETVQSMTDLPDFRGTERFNKRLAYLRDRKPAYRKAKQAREKAEDGHLDQAMTLVNEAIAIESEEAAFHALKGQILSNQKQPEAALSAFDRAVNLYPQMFSYRLERGLLHLEQDHLELAREDLATANETVPTSIATLRLGDIARQQGDTKQAIAYYQRAAEAGGEVGQEALRKLQNLTKAGS
ncbi:putative Zn-dependent protease [Tamilnaduibacter salinus]|uniref:Putative Zn-dependent protease n=1 Tax=Tamilnaduibacter salinus TaxID=1484056 RepID=A0A2U1D0D3_9GAMM|nr:M48 family metallopeptidase [Tamilnaduibacter salinus]PVY78384.1 putative Zn-dependent protease [Tamilnaduibacter salinus]